MLKKEAMTSREDFDLPWIARSIGFFTMKKGEIVRSSHTINTFVALHWCLRGKGTETLFEKEYLLEAQDVFWYLPGEDYRTQAKTDDFSYVYLTMTGPLAAAILLSYKYPRLIKNAGPAPESVFREILNKIAEPSLYTARHLTTLSMEILERAGGTGKQSFSRSQIGEHFVELVNSSLSDPSLNINSIADMLGVHRTTLTRLVKKELKRSPSEYLLSRRASHGINLLRGTDLPISEVARACGLPNVTYFDRIVRRSTGKTPTEVRQLKDKLSVDISKVQ